MMDDWLNGWLHEWMVGRVRCTQYLYIAAVTMWTVDGVLVAKGCWAMVGVPGANLATRA